MATLKLKPKPARAEPSQASARPHAQATRAPLRGHATRPRPTAAQAEAERLERTRAAGERVPVAQAAPTTPFRRDARTPQPQPQPNVDRAARPSTPRPNVDRHARPLTPPHAPTDRHPPPSPRIDRDPRESGRRPTIDSRPRVAASQPTPDTHADEGIRLSKRMSALGIASRREADEWIPKGWVRVDGRVVDQLGARVLPGARITVDAAARHAQAQRVTVLIHKPLGLVSGQAEDGHTPAVVLVTPDRQWREDASGIRHLPMHLRGLAPAGRLDIDSVGLLVLTQDGRIARQLIGDDSTVEKEYEMQVTMTMADVDRFGHVAPRSRLPDAGLALLRHGLTLDGVALQPAQVDWIADDHLRFVLIEGRKRQIRRMCEAVGLQVLALKRVRIGLVALGGLPQGQWRYLRRDEVFTAVAPPDGERR